MKSQRIQQKSLAKLLKTKQPKYKNVRHNGFDSKGESRRFDTLSLLEKAGHIQNLKKQVPYRFVHNDTLICTYIADFVYTENGTTIVEDFKSPITRKNPTYVIKKKMMMAFYGIKIRETSRM